MPKRAAARRPQLRLVPPTPDETPGCEIIYRVTKQAPDLGLFDGDHLVVDADGTYCLVRNIGKDAGAMIFNSVAMCEVSRKCGDEEGGLPGA